MAELFFWLTVAGIGYAYVGFPLLLVLVAYMRPRPVLRGKETPTMSLIVAAHNEEDQIEDRVVNALRSDYPADGLEVLVAADGCTDRTVERVRALGEPRVRVLELPRQGKLQALDAAVREARGEILVFSDANTVMDAGALRAMAGNFADPRVGGVAGHTGYRLESHAESSGRGEGLYWRYDTWLKQMESRTGSVVSAHGGLYAIRRALYQIPEETAVTDDFIISTGVVAQGFRLVFEPEARAFEAPAPAAAAEFGRRVRLMTRGWRAVFERRDLLNPARYGFYAVVLLSHKVVRRLVPLGLPVLLASSLVLAPRSWIFGGAALAQLAFYALAIAGAAMRGKGLGHGRVLYVPFYFCLANAAALLAFLRFLRGDRIQRWQPQRHAVEGRP
jgi:cellulose synthase/poly-beta-1,6-N-acetylglucosamine synthase-like glycosyltransferase